MNYLLELNAFYRLLEGTHLSTNTRLLWHELMQRANLTGWAPWLSIPVAILMARLGLRSTQSFYRAQKQLVETGLLEVQSGHSHVPNRYHLIPPSALLTQGEIKKNSDPTMNLEKNEGMKIGMKTKTKTEILYKQDKRKQNNYYNYASKKEKNTTLKPSSLDIDLLDRMLDIVPRIDD